MESHKNNIPILRFPEFKDDWGNSELGNFILSHKSGASLTPKDFANQAGKEVIPKKAIIAGGKLNLDKTNPTYCSTEFYALNQKSIVDNEYLITTLRDLVPSGPSIGYIVQFEEDVEYLLAQGVYGLKVNSNKINKNFLTHFSNTNKYRKIMKRIKVGSTQIHIRNKDFYTVRIFYPEVQEQQKIASFLSFVDKKIYQLQKKKELLEQYKKGMMQKIFKQEIRFKDENGKDFPEWKEKKLGEILKIGSGKDYKHLNEGDIPVYGTGGYMTSVDEPLYNGESVGIGRKGTIDKPIYLNGKFWTVDTLFYTHSFNQVLPKFIYRIFQQINWLKYNEASGVPSLSKKTLEKIKVEIPSLEEQTKIANFLSAIDDKVDLVTTEIEKASQFKKGLLQQMFV